MLLIISLFFLKSAEYKLALIKSLKVKGILNLNMQGYFSDFISHLFVRNFLTVFYAIFIFNSIYSIYKIK
jgi:hypothetical protein